MDWQFERAGPGNVALTGEIDLSRSAEFTLAIAFGKTVSSGESGGVWWCETVR
jgi:hypothetical protein